MSFFSITTPTGWKRYLVYADRVLFAGLLIALLCQVFLWLWPAPVRLSHIPASEVAQTEESPSAPTKPFQDPSSSRMIPASAPEADTAEVGLSDYNDPVALSSIPLPATPAPRREPLPMTRADRLAHAASVHAPTLAPGQTIAINSASASAIEALPRVGPKLAARIVAWRQQHGSFHSLSDLDQVKGIGPKLLATIEPLIRF